MNRPVGVRVVLWCHGETGVVLGHKLIHQGVGGVQIIDALQAQFLDQPILQGLIGPLHAPLWPGAVGVNRLNVQALERTGELGQLPSCSGWFTRKMLWRSE